MPLISFRGVSAGYGAVTVLSEVNFQLDPGQRLGLVGPNGAGKTTLFRLLTGELAPLSGKVEIQKGTRVALLHQEMDPSPLGTVLEAAMHARGDLVRMRHRLEELEHQMSSNPPDLEAVLEEYGEAQSVYLQLGGYTLEATARRILGGLGLRDEVLEQDPGTLSGGQRRRLELAGLLLQEADVLLLDEPTNHLDLEAIEWLEDFLNASPQAMLVVSHDRRLLDNVATGIVEIEQGRSHSYPGNYSAFVRLRGERRSRALKEWEAQQEHIRHNEEFIRRYRAGQRAREAKGRQKLLDRLERVERPAEDSDIRVQLTAEGSGREALRSEGLEVGFGETTLVTAPGFLMEAGERVAIVGRNGTGKSTLLKTFAGELKPLRGNLKRGARLKVSHYDQHMGNLDPEQTVLDVLREGRDMSTESARSHLARVDLAGDDVFKRIEQLSGGERSRLKLARLMLDQANLLLLDEPTNHLDIPSQEVLEEALRAYPGTLVFVTHDRFLVDAVATSTWTVEGGLVEMSSGGYRPGAAPSRRGGSAPAPARPREQPAAPAPPTPSPTPAKAKKPRSLAALRRDLAGAEAEIGAVEEEVTRLEAQMSDPVTYQVPGLAQEAGSALASAQARATELLARWTSLGEELAWREGEDTPGS